MKVKMLLFNMLAVLLGGCVLSLHPLYTEKDLIFEEKLLGTWGKNGSTETWQFKRGKGDKYYSLTLTDDKGKEGSFVAGLGKINNMMFLNIFPQEPELKETSYYQFHILRANSFIKIEQIEPTLVMRIMNPDTVQKMLKKNPKLIKHEIVDDRLLLTASTEELQKFMKAHANEEGLFNGSGALERVPPGEPNSAGPE